MVFLIYAGLLCAGVVIGVLAKPMIVSAFSTEVKAAKAEYAKLKADAEAEYTAIVTKLHGDVSTAQTVASAATARAEAAEASLAALRAALQPSLPFPAATTPVAAVAAAPGGAMAASPAAPDPVAAIPLNPPTTPPATLL